MSVLRILKTGAPFAILAVSAGAVIAATSSETFAPAYGGPTALLGAGAAQIDAANAFEAADADRSGALSADEFAAMRLVTAELAHLNGFVAVVAGEGADKITLPIEAPAAISTAERARIFALAYQEFYAAAGPDAKLSRREYLARAAQIFVRYDRDRNGVLARYELTRFAAEAAFLSPGEV
jgi:Ca2+-binding EF-hand superfamily protein